MKKLFLILAILLCSMWGWGQVSLPYFCGFESSEELEGLLFSRLNFNTGLYYENESHTNTIFAFHWNFNPPQYLILSSRITNGNNDIKLSFKFKNLRSDYPETFSVGYSSNTNAIDYDSMKAYFNLFTFDNSIEVSNTQWNYYEKILPSETKHFTIRYESNNKYYLAIDDICLEYNIPLPINLLSFTATPYYTNYKQWSHNLIQWTTATETNNDYFILESSSDAVNFKEISRIAGAGSSIKAIDYEFKDYNPVADITYYRLTQVDYDGTITPSDIVACERMKGNYKPEYIKRSEEGITVTSYTKTLDVRCYDILGREIGRYKVQPFGAQDIWFDKSFIISVYEDGNLVGSEKMLK